MPGFDLNPAAGTQSYGNPALGNAYIVKKKKGGGFKATDIRDIKINDTPSGSGTPSKSSSSKSSDKKKGRNKNKNKGKQRPAEYNPLLAPFKTPNQIRAEAAALAALGVVPEETLRSQQALEEAGIRGLTTGLSGRLAGLASESAAQNRGILTGYQNLAGQAQAGGESAVAAAGGPAGMAPAGSQQVTANTLAALGAVPQTYAPAAELTGAGLIGQSRANLSKALAERSARLSADTAKYLQQLQSDELQRAISGATLEQNQARLNLSGEQEAWNQKVDLARLEQSNARIKQGWQRLANQAKRDAAKNKASKGKGLQSAKNSILTNYDKYIGDVSPTGKFEYTIYYQAKDNTLQRVPRTVIAANESDAIKQATGMVPNESVGTISAEQGKALLGPPSVQQVINNVAPILINKGATRAQAIKWIRMYLLPRITTSSTGGYMGGVGGSVG